MITSRSRLVRATLERAIQRPYSYPRHDCAAVALRVARAIDPSVKFPRYPAGSQSDAYSVIREAGGLIAWVEKNLPAEHGFRFGPVHVRPGDIFMHADPEHLLGAWIGVFDSSLLPVTWTEESILEPMGGWPERVWTYGDEDG